MPVESAYAPAVTRPEDFEGFWRNAMSELAVFPAAPEIEAIPLRGTDFSATYGVRLTSIGPYRIFCYYSVPHGGGPFPAIVHCPGYASVVPVPSYEERRSFVCLSVSARGQRLSDKPFAAAFPGLLTEGIEEPATYIYRGIVADTCRAIDFLLNRPEVDQRRIAVIGGDTAIAAAALRPALSFLVASAPIFYDPVARSGDTDEYPLEEINDYKRIFPDRAAEIAGTLAYFDSLFFAPMVKAETLLNCQPDGGVFDLERTTPLAQAFTGPKTIYRQTGYGLRDFEATESWLHERLLRGRR